MNSKTPDLSKPTCRVCLQSSNDQEMSSIYDLDADLDDIFIYEKIEQCAGIEVLRDENLPTFICENCYRLLKMAYEFRITCRNSEELLKKILAMKVDKTKIEQSLNENPLLIKENTTSKKGTRPKAAKFVKHDSSPIPDLIKKEIIIHPDSSTNFEEPISDNFEDYEGDALSFEVNYNNDENNTPSDEDTKVLIEETHLQEIGKRPRSKKANKRKKNSNVKGKKTKKARSKILAICKDDNEDEEKNQKTTRPKKEKKEKRPHICEICGNKFPHSYTLKNHIKRHLNEKSFNCEICGYSCHSNMELVRHLRRHTGSKPFKCKYCTRAFGDNSTLIKHERVHRNERPFKCEICGSSFSYPAVLKRHKLVHTGEKPYKCEICGKCFNDRYHLISHLKTIQHKDDPRVEMFVQKIKENNVHIT